MPAFLVLTLAVCEAFAQKPPPVPVDPGPKKGERLPAFQLKDQNGKEQSLRTLRGRKGLMLVFFRSADW